MKNKYLRFSLAVLISLAGLYIAFRGIDWQAFIHDIGTVSLPWYFLGMLGMLVMLVIRAAKWQLLLKPLGHYPVIDLYKGTIAGFFTNYVLPFRMGEIARAYITGNLIKERGAKIFPSIVVERFIDSIAFFLFVILFSFFFELKGLTEKQILLTRVIIVILLAVFVIALLIYRNKKETISVFLSRRDGGFWKIIKDLHQGFLALFNVEHVWLIFLGSLLIWAVTGFTYYAGVKACHLDLGFTESYILFITAMIAIAIPAAPGYVGTFHAAMVATLALFGIDKTGAQSYAVLQHLQGMIPICLFGFIHFLEANTKLKDISKLEEDSI